MNDCHDGAVDVIKRLYATCWSGFSKRLDNTDVPGNFVALALMGNEEGAKLQVSEPPVPLRDLSFRVIWNRQLDGDPAVAWIRGIVFGALADLIAGAERPVAAAEAIMPRRRPGL